MARDQNPTLLNYAVWLSRGRIRSYTPAFWLRGISRYARDFQRLAIGNTQMPGDMGNPDGMLTRTLVQVVASGLPLFAQQGVIITSADDPSARHD